MTPERWKVVEKILSSVLECDPADRSRFLDEQCGGDDILRKEVEAFLRHEQDSADFLNQPAIEVAAEIIAREGKPESGIGAIGPYTVLSRLGAGGMGEVYLAQDHRLGRKVALKILPQRLTQNEVALWRFEREARAASALNHPNILTIYEIGKEGEFQYIATEFIEGQTLRGKMTLGKIEIKEMVRIAIETATALAAAHDAGIVHRDVKPENIMIRNDGLIKVLDFGLAKLIEMPSQNPQEAITQAEVNTETGLILGTTRYMSPEQARGLAADARSDVFSLGVVLYELIASRPPFTGDTGADMIVNLLTADPLPLAELSPTVPLKLEQIVNRSLKKNVAERYPSVSEMLADLKDLLREIEFEDALKRTNIAREMSEKLLQKINNEEKKQFQNPVTQNVEAYHAYLRGRYYWNKRTAEDLKKAIENFSQAIDIDPCMAAAQSGLADCYLIQGSFGVAALAPKAVLPKAKHAATKALEIDDSLADANATLGHVSAIFDWNWPASEKYFHRSFELKRDYPSSHHWYGMLYLVATGKLDDGLTEVQQAFDLDPLSLSIGSDVGFLKYLGRRYDEAIADYAKLLETDRNFIYGRWKLGLALEQKGKHAEAIAEFQKSISLSRNSALPLTMLGHAYAASGQEAEARAILKKVHELQKERFISPYRIALIYAALNEMEQAFHYMEEAYQERDGWLIWMKYDPAIDPLRFDRRFETLYRRIGLGSERKAQASSNAKTIAVLPFQPLNAEVRDEYLELGMADALITRLSELREVVVRPTSSIRKYMKLDRDPVQAGRDLSVDSVLEGSLQRHQDRIRVTARLIKVEDGSSLWTGKFDENSTDIFAVEDSISEKIMAALVLRVTEEEKSHIAKRYTQNQSAYQMYLKGRYYWNKRAEGALLESIEYFREAINMDPTFALAYAGLGDSYTYLGDAGITAISPREAFSKGKAAAAKALEIDDTLAEAHAVMAHLNLHFFQWSDAEREFKRTLELKPNYATVHEIYSYYLLFMGKMDEALAESAKAQELDPLSEPINADAGDLFYFARRYDEAIQQLEKFLRAEPQYVRARLYLGRAYQAKGNHEKALTEFHRCVEIARTLETISALAHSYAVAGMEDKARALLKELNELSVNKYFSPYNAALIYTALGDVDRAFDFLEKAYDIRAEWMIYISVDPRLDLLRDDTRFKVLLRKMALA